MQALQDKFLNGQLLLINKPIGWTSFDVVRKIHYQLKNQLELLMLFLKPIIFLMK